MKPSLALRLTKPHLLQPVLSGGGAAAPWYLAGGIPAANCLRAYQPMLADDLADSYVNLINPGTGNITQVGAPAWGPMGWVGNGSSSSLNTGLTNASGYKSVAIRFDNAAAGNLKAMFGVAGTGFTFYAMPNNNYTTSNMTLGFSNETTVTPPKTSGTLIMTGRKAYYNGADVGFTFNVFTPVADAVYVLSAGARFYGNMRVQAVAFYDIDITSYVTALHNAMAGLGTIAHTIYPGASDFEDNFDVDEGTTEGDITYIRANSFSRVMFQTTAQILSLTLYSTMYASYPAWSEVGVWVDGVHVATQTVNAANTTSGWLVGLPGGAGVNKIVEVHTGVQGIPGGAPIKGTWLVAAGFDKAASIYHPAASEDRIVFYGDSIIQGGNAADSNKDAAVQIIRQAYSGQVAVNAYGSRGLWSDNSTAGARQTFAEEIASYSPTIVYMAIGTNDYGLGLCTSTNFGIGYADLLDKLHTELPDAAIYCQTPLTRGTETELYGGFGDLPAYRTQIATAVSTRTAYCTLVAGPSMVTFDADYDTDDLHLTAAGQAIWATAIMGELGIGG